MFDFMAVLLSKFNKLISDGCHDENRCIEYIVHYLKFNRSLNLFFIRRGKYSTS